MTPGSKLPEPSKQVEPQTATPTPEIEAFLQELFTVRDSDLRGTLLTNHGQIDFMRMPENWVEGKPQSTLSGTSLLREFHPLDHPEVQICFFYRGQPMSSRAAEYFHSVLQQPAHILTKVEIESLAETMWDKRNSKDFQLFLAQTEELNGKMVLVLEGRYNQIEEDTHALYIDADKTGSAVQEIYYQAPRADYSRHLMDALASLKTISWK